MIILASKSPRRKEILKEILGDIPFLCVPSSFDERQIHEKSLRKLCKEEAVYKAKAVAERYPDDIIIASDTMVLYNGLQLGKPKDEEEAFNMLLMLQDHVHEVITAYTIYQGGKELVTRAVSAHLYIEKMADLEIREYIETGSPMDKAGAYGVQDKDFITSRIIDGDEYTIMGLPLFDLEDDLYSLGILDETKTTSSVLG